MRRLTSRSISPLDIETSNAGSLHDGKRRTHAGLSHSCERPTRVAPASSAQTISVALASRETTRIPLLPAAAEQDLDDIANVLLAAQAIQRFRRKRLLRLKVAGQIVE